MTRLVLAALGVFVVAAEIVPAQPPLTLTEAVGRITEERTGRLVSGAQVTVLESGRIRSTDDSGFFRIPLIAGRQVRLVASKGGYRNARLEVTPGITNGDTLLIELTADEGPRAPLTVRDRQGCDRTMQRLTAAETVLARIFDSLRVAASRLGSEASRSSERIEVVRASRSETGMSFLETVDTVSSRVRDDWTYQAGRLMPRPGTKSELSRKVLLLGVSPYGQRIGFAVSVPSIAQISSEAFIKSHCFAVAEVIEVANERVMRVPFRVMESVKGTDVDGTLYVDAETLHLRRAAFRFSRLPRELRNIEEAEVLTVYRMRSNESPSITDIETLQSFRPGSRNSLDGMLLEVQRRLPPLSDATKERR